MRRRAGGRARRRGRGRARPAIDTRRYGNHGTVTSRLFFSTADTTAFATSSGSITNRRRSGLRSFVRCGKPSVSTNPGMTVCTRMPAAAEQRGGRARERELRVLRGGVRAGRREGDRASDRDHVDDVRSALGGGGAEAGQERAQAPQAAEVVHVHRPLDALRVDVEEAAAGRDAGVVHEQVDRRMTLEDSRGDRVDLLPVGHVADLPFAADLPGERLEQLLPACQEDAVPAAAVERTRGRLSDPR